VNSLDTFKTGKNPVDKSDSATDFTTYSTLLSRAFAREHYDKLFRKSFAASILAFAEPSDIDALTTQYMSGFFAAQLPLSQVWCAFSPASERKRTPAMNCSFSKEALVMMPVEPVMFSGSMYQGISAIFNEPTKNGSVEFGFLMSLSLSLHQSCLSM